MVTMPRVTPGALMCQTIIIGEHVKFWGYKKEQEMMRIPRMWRGPQEEHRTVSTETEVRIPNLEAISICAFSAISTLGFLWWGRFYQLWFPPLLVGTGAFLGLLKKQVTMQGLGLGIPEVLPRNSRWRVGRAFWKAVCFLTNSVIVPAMNRTAPGIASAAVSFYGMKEAMEYWFSEMPWWTDILLALSAGFATATAAVVYFHWNNIRNPAWPPPYWYVEGAEEDNKPVPEGERSGYARRTEEW